MIRPTTIMMGSVLLLAGCGQGQLELTDQVDAASADANSSVNRHAAKSPIIRALLQEIDEIEGEDPEVIEELRRALLGADDELALGLGVTMTGGHADAAEEPSAGKRASRLVQVKRPSPDPADDEPQTPIIKALLKALDESDEDDDDDRDELRSTLIEADKQLRQILGGRSKRLIEAANRKPLVPIIGPCPKAIRGEKTSAKKASAEKEPSEKQ